MRLLGLVFTLVCFASCVLAWDKEDHEIFDLQSAVETAEGKGTTFYSWLDVSPTATSAEIGKAYRKMSLLLHPDKNPGVKNAEERYARLGVVQKILRSENRERYDFFHKNGFPRWRGTGYYYSRFRPGVGTVLVFLTLITAGMQYLVHRMNYTRDVARIQTIIDKARRVAWGPKLNRVETRRKVKVNMGGREAQVDEDGNEYGGGRFIDMVVEGDNVWLVEADGELSPVDTTLAVKPSWSRTWPAALAQSLAGRVGGKMAVEADSVEGTDTEESEAAVTASNGNANGSNRRRKTARK